MFKMFDDTYIYIKTDNRSYFIKREYMEIYYDNQNRPKQVRQSWTK